MKPDHETSDQISMAIDLKKYRLRIHKQTLRLLGCPHYVQLLLSTRRDAIVVLSRESEAPGGMEIKVVFDKKDTSGTFDIYCKELITRIREQFSGLDDNCLYRLTGFEISEAEGVCFPLHTLTRTEEPHALQLSDGGL